MKKYALSALVAMMAVLAPVNALYAAGDAGPIDAAASVETAATAPETAPMDASVPDAPDAAPAPAEETADPAKKVDELTDKPLDTIGKIREEAKSGNWGSVILMIIILLVSGLRWGANKLDFLSFFKGKLGGYILVFSTSTAGMLLTLGASFSLANIQQAVVFGFGAIGGWEAWKDIRGKKKAEDEA